MYYWFYDMLITCKCMTLCKKMLCDTKSDWPYFITNLQYCTSINPRCFRLCFGLFGKLSRRRGALAWFHGVWTCVVKVFEYWMIFSLKIKLNHSWNFWRNWNVPLVLLERSWWAGFDGIYLVRFRFKMWEILI
jgi:hypothetical protein